MAERRMFSKSIIESDKFLDLPTSTRLLYFDLGMRGDDDGFVDSPKRIMRITGASDDDLKLLIAKQFIIPFESGVIVVRHWRIHNFIRNDRYKPTQYQNEKNLITEEANGAYRLWFTDGIPNDNQASTVGIPVGCIGKDSIGKVRLDKARIDSACAREKSGQTADKKKVLGEFGKVRLSDEEQEKLIQQLGNDGFKKYVERLDGWLAEGNSKKNHYATILNWWRSDSEKGNLGRIGNKPVKPSNTSYDIEEIDGLLEAGKL